LVPYATLFRSNEGAVLNFDKPWEGNCSGYCTIIKDGDLYRMYYRGIREAGKDGNDNEVTCYAESTDGIHWTKPSLGIYEIDGTLENRSEERRVGKECITG